MVKNFFKGLDFSFRKIFWAALFNFIVSFMTFFGIFYYSRYSMPYKFIIISALLAIPFTIILTFAYIVVVSCRKKERISAVEFKLEYRKSDILYLIICTAVIFACWVPVLLAYYPGIFAYDVHFQIPQKIVGYSTHHPLVHTLLLQFFYFDVGVDYLNNVTEGMFYYTLMQMSILAFSLGYAMVFLRRLNLKWYFKLLVIAFFSGFPSISVMAVSMTKDVIYAAGFIVSMVILCYFGVDNTTLKKIRHHILFFVSALVACLFRNNHVYIMAILGVCSLFFVRKVNKKYLLLINIVLVIVAYYGISSNLKSYLNAEDGSQNEMLSIPYQQFAYIYKFKQESLTEEEKTKLVEFCPAIEAYNIYNSDPIKTTGTIPDDYNKFIDFYIPMLKKYPFEFVEATLKNTIGYWYIFDKTSADIYSSKPEERQGYLLTDYKNGFGIKHKSKFPELEKLYEELFTYNKCYEIPVVSIIFSMALYVYIWLGLLVDTIARKNRRMSFAVIYPLGLIASLILGPCAIVRYVFPLMCVIPILIAVATKDYTHVNHTRVKNKRIRIKSIKNVIAENNEEDFEVEQIYTSIFDGLLTNQKVR